MNFLSLKKSSSEYSLGCQIDHIITNGTNLDFVSLLHQTENEFKLVRAVFLNIKAKIGEHWKRKSKQEKRIITNAQKEEPA